MARYSSRLLVCALLAGWVWSTPASSFSAPQHPGVLTGKMDDEEEAGDGQARFEAALGLVRKGQERQAAEALVSLSRELPQDDIAPEALFEAAQLYEEHLADPATAQRLYGEVRDRYPQSRLSRRAQGRYDELTLGLRTGASALSEFNDILATYRTRGIARTIERLQKFLADHPGFALSDRALYLLGTAYRDAGDDAAAQRTFTKLLSAYPRSPWAPRATQVFGEMLLARRDFAAARARFATLRNYGGPLWNGAADEGIERCDRAQRRGWLALFAVAYLMVFAAWLGVRGRRHLWPPPFETYYYVPVAGFLVLTAYLSGGPPVGRTVLLLALGGTALSWLSAATPATSSPRTGARRMAAIAGAVLFRALAAAALLFLVVYQSGLFEVILETLRNGPETG
jgi:TolA-binding protein